jgi:hypothetical protein
MVVLSRAVAIYVRIRRMNRRTPKPKLTDAERHKRFVDMAKEVAASDDPMAFDRAFNDVTAKRPAKNHSNSAK